MKPEGFKMRHLEFLSFVLSRALRVVIPLGAIGLVYFGAWLWALLIVSGAIFFLFIAHCVRNANVDVDHRPINYRALMVRNRQQAVEPKSFNPPPIPAWALSSNRFVRYVGYYGDKFFPGQVRRFFTRRLPELKDHWVAMIVVACRRRWQSLRAGSV